MRAKEFVPGNQDLIIFDIDDTLMHTTAEIKVIKNGQIIRSLNNQEFNTYTLKPGEEFDFGEFRSAEKFRQESKPIVKMIHKLKTILNHAGNAKVIMLTARSDFDDKETFLQTFRDLGIDMNRVHVHRAGNLPGNEHPAHKKAVWVRKYLNTGKYGHVRLYDDSMSNLRVFKDLKQEYPTVDFRAIYVGPGGDTQALESDLDEGWKDTLASLGIAGAIAAGGTGALTVKQALTSPNIDANDKIEIVQKADLPNSQELVKKLQKQSPAAKPTAASSVTDSPYEKLLKKYALSAGIKGTELAAFLAQCAHETMDFQFMKEIGNTKTFKKYDPKHAPRKARALGNKHAGDGAKYKGRGFIQLTGRDNYKRAGQALGLPLEQKPHLVEKPEIAAKVAIWFWQTEVRPNVNNFNDVVAVTKQINPGLAGLNDRKENFKMFKQVVASL